MSADERSQQLTAPQSKSECSDARDQRQEPMKHLAAVLIELFLASSQTESDSTATFTEAA